MSAHTPPVVIAGAGPAGMVAAADLVRQGVPVLVLEKLPDLSTESRASTFHPPTLDMLETLGFADKLISGGLKAPIVQYSTTKDGELGSFNFGQIADITNHPFRLQAEQYKLTRIILDDIKNNPLFQIAFNSEVTGVSQDRESVSIQVSGPDSVYTIHCSWLLGTDGAGSNVRRSQNIDFEGFTWPERFLVMTTSADLFTLHPSTASVSYVADPDRWYFLLHIVNAWRIMMPVPGRLTDEQALDAGYIERSIRRVIPHPADPKIQHVTLYRVHQRVASKFRLGRTFLAGDAAHINNPLGGMGMNSSIHDALNLTEKLGSVIQGGQPDTELDKYETQRRTVTMEAVQNDTIRNKRNLEAKTAADQKNFREEIRSAAANSQQGYNLLRRIAMFDSLERANSLAH